MKTPDLMRARRERGWTQQESARRTGVSQPYWSQLERGGRRLTDSLARRLVREFGFPATLLPLPEVLKDAAVDNDAMAEDLAKLDYPAFAYMTGGRRHKRNPALVMLSGLALRNLEPRVYEGLPWLLLRYPGMDTEWMADQARRHDLQNQLGFTATLARRVAEQHTHLNDRVEPMQRLEDALRDSLLAREEGLNGSRPGELEREWMLRYGSADAAEWSLLTNMTPEDLQYASWA